MIARRRGLVMVVTLAAIAGVVMGVAIFAQNQNNAVQMTINRNELRRARVAALAGVQYALTSIQTISETPQDPVTADDDWAQLGQTGAEEFILGSESFRVQIVDNSTFIDLNTVTEAQLNNLNLTQQQIDSLLDWREAGNTQRTEGAKDEFYNGLARPYNAHLNRFQSVNEIFDVQGFTPADVFNTNQNTFSTVNNALSDTPLYNLLGIDCYSSAFNPEGNGKANINLNTLTAQQLAQNAQIPQQNAQTIIQQRNAQPNQRYARLSQVLALQGFQNNQNLIRSVLDRMTTSATERVEGLINVNTATSPILQTIPGVTQDIADQIVNNRPAEGYRQLSELLSVSSDPQFVNAIADNLCVNSQSFLIRVIGKAGRMKVALQALVTINNAVPTITRIEDAPFPDMDIRWTWADATTQTTLLENQ